MKYLATVGSECVTVEVDERDGPPRIAIDGTPAPMDIVPSGADGTYSILIDGRSYTAVFLEHSDVCRVMIEGTVYEFEVEEAELARLRSEVKRKKHAGTETIKAPMPGRVLAVSVATGDTVAAGQDVLIIEAMKMENTLRAHADAKVKEIRVAPGDIVDKGDVLVVLEP